MALSHARGKAESACLLRCLVIPGGPSPPHLSAQAFGLVHRLSPAELQLERVPPRAYASRWEPGCSWGLGTPDTQPGEPRVGLCQPDWGWCRGI